jgi:hypothetical protein
LRLGQLVAKIGDGLAFTFDVLGFDVDVEHTTRPAMFDSTLRVGQTHLRNFQAGQQH